MIFSGASFYYDENEIQFIKVNYLDFLSFDSVLFQPEPERSGSVHAYYENTFKSIVSF